MSKSSFDRREFLKFAGASGVLSSCTPLDKMTSFLKGKTEEFIYVGYRHGEMYDNTNAGLHIKSETRDRKIQLKNEVHSIIHSKKHDLKVYIPKLDYFAYFQFGHGKIQELMAIDGHYFYGHGAIDEKRNVLYLTKAKITKTRDEEDRAEEPGFVYVYSIPDFKLIDKFTSYGRDPHEMILHNDQILVCNGGSDSSIAVIDPDSRKLIKSYHVNVPHLSLRHISIIDDENFLIAPLTRVLSQPCPPYSLNFKTGLHAFSQTNDTFNRSTMEHQLLNLIHFKGLHYAACPMSDTILIWDINGKFVGGLELVSASGLVVSKTYDAVIASSASPNIQPRIIRIKDGVPVFEVFEWGKGMMGSHAVIFES